MASATHETGLKGIAERYPALGRLIDAVLAVWPEHVGFLSKSMEVRTDALLETSDRMAAAVLELAASDVAQHARDYRWLCDQIREEELNFVRTGHYRYSRFAETNANVYSDGDFMRRYMHGLLYSHVLWFMHISSLYFFSQRLAARVKPGGRVLEVGSGHGLLLFLALRDLGMAEAVAWDLSQVSLDQTRDALARLGALDRAKFAVQDMHKAEPGQDSFDLIILSHLLEHLEEPVDALKRLKPLLAKGGLLYVNVPLNAPMPDHLVLLEAPRDAEEMLSAGGFRVLEIGSHTTQAVTLSKALKQKTAVTCSIIAEPA
ncbi:MAG: methyltransferase domain-containing protein [Phenylobacterium sp.]|uniref:class I SAM-dependent methyltransferase n=1 Tax=Phenylobacterium sp. TaxID=1871053 RepID=UPI0025D6C5C6|nr:class I SAM-dependent methyltransferase [Phenylobacterium sp.]MBI1198455.1 methyltransferase domain-containing protein [Phenylobacterium sp.]